VARCLVVGANGFLGSHLVDELARLGHEVTAFDRFSSGQASYTASGVSRRIGDFLNKADLADAVTGQEFVFHFVSTTTPASAENDPTMDIRTNLASTVELLESCVEAGVAKVFFASTGGAIYGDQPGVELTETTLPLPISPYAIGKLSIEGYLRYFERKHGLASVIFRISNPYGPRQHPNKKQGVIPIFLTRLSQGLPLVVLGDGSMVRDYLYVGDVVRMIGQTVEADNAYPVYNIGRGVGASLADLLAVIERVTGIIPEIQTEPAPSTYLQRVVLKTERYQREFGYPEFVSLDEGVAATWLQLNGASDDLG
jgi:UDP-glucose 4-epimerase